RPSRPLLVLTPPSPRPTPSPYTTLFRSCLRSAQQEVGKFSRAADQKTTGQNLAHFGQIGMLEQILVPCPHNGDGHHGDRCAAQEDRKSTRLNSSHVSSSYAVFCLKNKRT